MLQCKQGMGPYSTRVCNYGGNMPDTEGVYSLYVLKHVMYLGFYVYHGNDNVTARKQGHVSLQYHDHIVTYLNTLQKLPSFDEQVELASNLN